MSPIPVILREQDLFLLPFKPDDNPESRNPRSRCCCQKGKSRGFFLEGARRAEDNDRQPSRRWERKTRRERHRCCFSEQSLRKNRCTEEKDINPQTTPKPRGGDPGSECHFEPRTKAGAPAGSGHPRPQPSKPAVRLSQSPLLSMTTEKLEPQFFPKGSHKT